MNVAGSVKLSIKLAVINSRSGVTTLMLLIDLEYVPQLDDRGLTACPKIMISE